MSSAEIWICPACGANHALAAASPEHCPRCEDERQWVAPTGQRWLIVSTPEGNLLWDPAPFVDDAALEAVRRDGKAILQRSAERYIELLTAVVSPAPGG